MEQFRIANDQQKNLAIRAIQALTYETVMLVKIIKAESKRSLEQNALMWELLGQLEKRAKWHGRELKNHHWKDLLTAGLKKQDLVPGIDGGWVALGERTSKMSIKKMTELIEFIFYFASEKPEGLEFDRFDEKPIPKHYLEMMNEQRH